MQIIRTVKIILVKVEPIPLLLKYVTYILKKHKDELNKFTM